MKVRMIDMLHEYTIVLPFNDVDEAVEKLTIHGYYYVYYDQPIEQFKEENGYGFIELKDQQIDFKIYIEETSDAPVDVEKNWDAIASILGVEKEVLHYQLLETEEWQEPFPVVDLKNGWVIKPTHVEDEIEGRVIHFEPPRAFGSGLHGTTQDCLRVILKNELRGKKVLDLGTGAGLLSIAAALVGAEKVLAVDIEDVEAEVTYNARLNNVEERISVIHGDVLQPDFTVEGVYDWILTNIAANEIRALKPFIDAHLVSNGRLLMSGMVDWNDKETLALYEKSGYRIEEILHSDEWVTALVVKAAD